jgi:hypothetical protein
VIGLSTEGTRKSWMVLDLPGLEITHESIRHFKMALVKSVHQGI